MGNRRPGLRPAKHPAELPGLGAALTVLGWKQEIPTAARRLPADSGNVDRMEVISLMVRLVPLPAMTQTDLRRSAKQRTAREQACPWYPAVQ